MYFREEKIICPTTKELSEIINKVECPNCNLIFPNEPSYQLHNLKVHEGKKLDKSIPQDIRYHCPIETCVYNMKSLRYFRTMKYLKQHYLKVHAEKTFRCTQCKVKSFSTEAAEKAHLRICGTSFACTCEKSFASYEALLTHAKRACHAVEKDKYKQLIRGGNLKYNKMLSRIEKPRTILPQKTVKSSQEIGIQTDFKYESRQTQTTENIIEPIPNRRRRKNYSPKKKQCSISTGQRYPSNDHDNFAFPESPLPLIGLHDFWEDKNQSGTRVPMFHTFSEQVEEYSFASRSDPLFVEQTFDDKFNSIETQTEQAYSSQSFFYPDTLSSTIETQTTDNLDSMEQLLYSNTCTQTCDQILPSDLGLSNIQTQTAWTRLEDTVSTETQTKTFTCQSEGCMNSMGICRSWLNTRTSHTETQTDLLSIFEQLD